VAKRISSSSLLSFKQESLGSSTLCLRSACISYRFLFELTTNFRRESRMFCELIRLRTSSCFRKRLSPNSRILSSLVFLQ
jgi:hypothetical protein